MTFWPQHKTGKKTNSQRNGPQQGNCDPLVNIVGVHYFCQPLTIYSLYLTGHPNSIILHNLHYPQYLCALNNADYFFPLTNLLIFSWSTFLLLLQILILFPSGTSWSLSNLYHWLLPSFLHVPWAISSLPSFNQINARKSWEYLRVHFRKPNT